MSHAAVPWFALRLQVPERIDIHDLRRHPDLHARLEWSEGCAEAGRSVNVMARRSGILRLPEWDCKQDPPTMEMQRETAVFGNFRLVTYRWIWEDTTLLFWSSLEPIEWREP